jgi:hypothetical protein
MLPCRLLRDAAASSSRCTRLGRNPTSSASLSICNALSVNGMRESHVRGSHGAKASALPLDNSSFNRAAMPKEPGSTSGLRTNSRFRLRVGARS